MDLTTATPAEIDTRLVKLTFDLAVTESRLNILTIRNNAVRMHGEIDIEGVAKLRKKLSDLEEQLSAIDAEFERRGGWTRVWVVPGGHGHRTRDCHSMFATTIKVLAPRDIRGRDLSGASEEEIVAAVGERACTFCYPSAPVDKPSTIVLPDEDAKMKARAEREAKRQEAAAKKAAKAITHPDGSRIRHDGWWVDTEAEAQRLYVAEHADAVWNPYGLTAERLEELKAEVEHLLVAIAHKHGETVEQARERLAPKIAAKAKRDKRESEKTARRLGLR